MRRGRAGIAAALAALAGVSAVAWFAREPRPAPLEPPRAPGTACRSVPAPALAGPVVEVRVVFGYKDARPARFVADRYERLLLVERLLAECSPGERVCGFRRDPRDVERFVRAIEGTDGASREIRVRVVAASVGPDDEENRKDPFQAWRSRHAERSFLEGLGEAHVVIYNGHSRGGGGPDFAPPRLRGGVVDYAWYRANRPGIRSVLARLGERAAAGLRVLGFLSCASKEPFADEARRLRPDLTTVSTPKLLYFSDAHAATVSILGAVLGSRCEAGGLAIVSRGPRRRSETRNAAQ